MQIKHLPNLRYTVAQLTPHQVLVQLAYQPYLIRLHIIIYSYYRYITLVHNYLLIIIVYVGKTMLSYEYDCAVHIKINAKWLN